MRATGPIVVVVVVVARGRLLDLQLGQAVQQVPLQPGHAGRRRV
jgi:hypothetical protein